MGFESSNLPPTATSTSTTSNIFSVNLLALTTFSWYLFKWRAFQRLFVSFHRLEDNLRVQREQDFKRKMCKQRRMIYFPFLITWVITIAMPFTLITFRVCDIISPEKPKQLSTNKMHKREELFDLIPSINLTLGVFSQTLSILFVTTTWSLMDQMPMVIYYYDIQIINLIKSNVKLLFDGGDMSISEKFLQIWSNYEHLSRLNGKIFIMYGFPNTLFPIGSFVNCCGLLYITFQSKNGDHITLFFLYIHVARLTSIIIVLHQKSAGHQKSETFAELSIQNAQHLLTDK